jgi:EAL domain-containing protein (putative c-di-GMP-specific phosphodiesterase class I)/GGDEF domain-containing protein
MMEDTMTAKKIQKNIRTITVAVLAVLFLVFYILLCISSLRIISTSTAEQYETDCRNLAHAYSNNITQLIERYLADLRVFSAADIFKSGTEDQIINWVHHHDERRPPYFVNLFYADKEGKLYSSGGLSAGISDRDYFKAIVLDGNETSVDDGSISRTTGKLVLHIARAVYNSKKECIGIIGAAVELTTIQKTLDNIKIGKDGYAAIVNSRGEFISHPDESFLLKKNTALIPGKAETNAQYIHRNGSGYFKTISVEGVPVSIAFEPIEETKSTLCIAIPESQVQELYNSVRRSQISIFFTMTLGIVICIIAETIILHILNEKFMKAADFDKLTGLLVRTKFEQDAQAYINNHPGRQFMFIDADIRSFKVLNQSYGTDRADSILLFFSSLLQQITEQYKGILGRGYADRFYALFLIPSEQSALISFRNSLTQVSEQIKKSEMPFYTKFGISFSNPAGRNVTVQDLTGKAAFAKGTIRNNLLYQYAVFTPDMQRQINEEQEIESRMESALTKREFFVVYQPKISLKTDKIVGAEALVRWNNPKFGIMSPAKFIPTFEKNGFVVELDFYVYNEVFKFLQKQIDEHNTVVPVSLNMSRNHTNPEQFVKRFNTLFGQYSIPPSLIEVEIIERTSDTGKFMLLETTRLLHENGFNVAMDDFGSGESSLNMLSTIPVDVLKFDQIFLKQEEYTDKTYGLIEKLVELGKHLNKQTIFEGVETKEQIDFLKSIHCDEVQGYFYSRPLNEQDFVKYIIEHI